MSLAPGTKLGPYEIVAPLGAGGMGEVWRARDSRLGRDVAVKVLPPGLADTPEIRARFEREARTISSLSHPNICTLYDVGREGGTDYLVMELVEGETLAARLQRGALPSAEVLRLGVQIADALDRAHRSGVVHRDLKPGNIMLTRAGAKVLDFGLARVTGLAPGVSDLSSSPTVARTLTAEGTIVGTFQYMAPEMLEGREADARSDIWALGCVLYEMATGRPAFEGRSQASLIAAILEREPVPVEGQPPSAGGASGARTPGGAPAGFDRLIRACLAKDPEDRLQTAHDVKLQLQWIAEGAGVSSVGIAAPAVAARRAGGAWLAWGVAVAAVLLALGATAWQAWRSHRAPSDYRFRTEPIPGAVDTFWPRVSPDGRWLVLQAVDSAGTVRAWVRPMDQTLARPILGSDGLQRAYWSPDSREIAFVAGGKIERLSISGGTPTVVCEARGGADLSWGSRGFILMDGATNDSLRVVPAGGGVLEAATRVDRAAGELGSAWPCFLPDGRHFLFIGTVGSGQGGNIRLGRLGSLDSKLLGHSDGRVEYAPGGWVLYLMHTTLVAQRLDLRAAKLTGQPLTIAENVRIGDAAGHFSVSRTGILAYSGGSNVPTLTLFEADRTGRHEGPALSAGLVANPALSPQGDRILFDRAQTAGGDREIWVRDLVRGTETKLTIDGGSATMPVWSPDGRRFACVQERGAGGGIVLIGAADGLGERDSIAVPGGGHPTLTQWSAVGSRLVVGPADFQGCLAAGADSAKPVLRPLAGLSRPMAQCVLSPDGNWAAYATNEGGGNPQVYVQSLTGMPGRWQISTGFGIQPLWTQGGRELLYESDASVMAVDIDTRGGFHPGTPRPLFPVPVHSGVDVRYWTCSADGRHFFLLVPPSQQIAGGIDVITDFASLVSRR